MRIRDILWGAISSCLFVVVAQPTFGQLYSENFDDLNAVSRWTAHAGVGFDSALTPVPMDTNFDTSPFTGVDGINDDFSGFSFDYSAVGIPSAPNSAGGSTIGMKLQASLFSNALGGFSASPNGLNLTGDYSVTFDAWSSSIGPFPFGGSGSTNLSTFGVLTAGTASNTILQTDGVFFAYTGEGGSGADYRAYSVEDANSYQWPREDPTDDNATYHAGNRNGTAQLYQDAVGSPTSVPQSVIDAFPGQDMSGELFPGSAGFAWQKNEIKKVGNVIDWSVNGFLLITVDTTNFAVPTEGGNISFGHSDINFDSSIDIAAEDLLFTLVDNIEVNAVTASADDADFNSDGDVDGDDFLTWQRGYGIDDGSALLSDGDATGDGNVGSADLAAWQSQFGTAAALSLPASLNAVPEPSSLVSLLLCAVFSLFGYRLRCVPVVVR